MNSLATDPHPGNTLPLRIPSVFAMAWRQLWRDWRAGELRLLMLAVALAVGALCAVAFLSDRIDRGLQRDAAQLLGGDAVVVSDQATPPALFDLAKAQGLAVSSSVTFPSMARAPEALGGGTRLAAIKAVDAAYPLRGRVTLRSALPQRSGAPAIGEVWADPALAAGLGLKLGDELLLGERSFVLSALIENEPDRGAGFMSFAPRVMLNAKDLASTGLIQPASRVTYRMAVAAARGAAGGAVSAFVAATQGQIAAGGWRGVRLESLESGRPEMRQTLDRATKFLRLVAMLSALLAAVAVGLAARDFASRHLDACAMLRVLGQPQRRIAWSYGLEFAMAALTASVIGIGIGLVSQQGFVALLDGLISVDLPPPGLWPGLLGLALGMSLLLGFGLPPVLQLAAVPAIRVIRRDLGAPRVSMLLSMAAGLAALGFILVALAGDAQLGLITALGFGAAGAGFAVLAWLAVLALRRLATSDLGGAKLPRWLTLATRQVGARPAMAVVEVVSLALGLLALALLVLLRGDLIDSWRQATPATAPNRFVINIQPDQAQPFRAALTQAGVIDPDWYPMIRGRLMSINGAAVKASQFQGERAQRLIEREFNLSHASDLPEHNQVVSGTWNTGAPDGISVESGLAATLGLKLGDRLEFDVAGQRVQGRVTSLRKVDWSSMRVNFFVLFQHADMPELPRTYIAAYRSPAGADLDAHLAAAFPNISVVDVSAQITQVQQVLNQVTQAVQALFAFTLATGLVVLLAAVGSTSNAKARDFAVMRALGARSSLLNRVQAAELVGVGLLAGLLAGLVAVGLGALLAQRVFDFDWQPRFWLPLAWALVGAVLTLATGWWTLRGVLRRPVVATLREAAQE